MSLPVVAIVGRPNVGKSSLLNMLAGKRISIVDPIPGVTRDRVTAVIDVDDRYFELIDTGGYGVEDQDNLTEHVEQQIHFALSAADLVLFVVDIQQEITPLDQEVAELLRGVRKPVQLVANKADTERHKYAAGVLTALGFGEPICVAALHARGRRDLLELIVRRLGEGVGEDMPDPVMKVALVGRRNVGKSTFINELAGQERVIVSEVPGTTRDSIDVRFELDGRTFMAIDTAGVSKSRRRANNNLEFYGYTRAVASIRRADVVLFLVDATAPISDVDKKLARLIVDEYKPCILVVNKWDLAKGKASAEDYGEYLAKTLPQISYAPVAFTTAIDGRNIKGTIEVAQSLFNQARQRVTTGQLNRAIETTLGELQPFADKHGASPKIYYATQVSVCPPTIVLFVNNPAFMREQYRRFAEKRIRESLPFEEVPVRLLWRARKSNLGGRRAASHDHDVDEETTPVDS
ncbi:MAG: ribosome biogenesis GTPase Der [Planctomycetota bacterium]|nr:MAG: ribosome biogenesis GTPase Der [Planctomycetota bacterium]